LPNIAAGTFDPEKSDLDFLVEYALRRKTLKAEYVKGFSSSRLEGERPASRTTSMPFLRLARRSPFRREMAKSF